VGRLGTKVLVWLGPQDFFSIFGWARPGPTILVWAGVVRPREQ